MIWFFSGAVLSGVVMYFWGYYQGHGDALRWSFNSQEARTMMAQGVFYDDGSPVRKTR